jgi:hypothetical protein
MTEIIFVVEEDETGGYTARALGEDIFAEAETRKELATSAKEAVRCHFSDRPEELPRVIRLHYVHDEVVAI